MMDLLVGGEKNRTVIWIGAPTMRDRNGRDKGVVELNRVMQEEAARSATPTSIYVDAYTCSATRTASTRTGSTSGGRVSGGRRASVRVGDGVHLTPAGAEYLATSGVRLARRSLPSRRASRSVAPDQLDDAVRRRVDEQRRFRKRNGSRKWFGKRKRTVGAGAARRPSRAAVRPRSTTTPDTQQRARPRRTPPSSPRRTRATRATHRRPRRRPPTRPPKSHPTRTRVAVSEPRSLA